AVTNPNAWYYQRPLTLDEHQASPWIAEPLRRYDCCQESDGAVAVVVVSPAQARALGRPGVEIMAAAQSSPPGPETMTGDRRAKPRGRRRDRVVGPAALAAQRLAARRHRPRHHLRPLLTLRPDATRSARVLRVRRGGGFRRRRWHCAGRTPTREHQRRAVERG